MNKPNLFKFATSELSQDAFICWILDHLNPEYNVTSWELRGVAFQIINRFLELAQYEPLIDPADVKSFKLQRQFENIDVLLNINEYIFIIEDKTTAHIHSNQLQRYVNEIEKNENYSNQKKVCIYFKTHDQSNYERIKKDGFFPFTRSDLLEIFQKYPLINNDIYQDFFRHIQKLEDEVEAYKTKSVTKNNVPNWNRAQWIGFFKELQKRLKKVNIDSNWGYVPNPSGGFMGLWAGAQGTSEARQYLVLESSKKDIFQLRIRVSGKSKGEIKEIRRKCIASYESAFIKNKFNMIRSVKKVDRLGSGKSVAIVNIQPAFDIDPLKPLDINYVFELVKETCQFIAENYWTMD